MTGQNRVSPLGAVLVAGLALARLVGVFPDERVSVSRNAVGAARHAVRPVFMMGALGTLVWTLQGRPGHRHTYLSILYQIPETDIKYLQKQIFNICFSIQLNLKNCISPVEQLHTDTNRQRENKSPNKLK